MTESTRTGAEPTALAGMSTPAAGGSPDPDEPRWPASIGLVGLLFGAIAALVLVSAVAFVYVAVGIDTPQDAASFDFTAGAAQDLALVAVALLVARGTGRTSARQFGFRPFRLSAFGWALLVLISYFILSAIYAEIVHPKQDDLLQELGAEKGTLLAVVSGIFVIGIAPVVEEFFFRGFLYQSLRTRLGVFGGAGSSGLIFGAVHLKLEFLVPLAILGVLLALLFQKTKSLWPCILVHALNNALVFAVTL